MISYVRREAADHALKLKKELVKLGASVYVDVDEIKDGESWDQSLNHAVESCVVFVILCTDSYTERVWTLNEARYAYDLNKHIIPVNFCDYWPPRKLGIQFSRTQFIPWLPPAVDLPEDFTPDGIKNWPDTCVKYVAKKINQQLNDQLEENRKSNALGWGFLKRVLVWKVKSSKIRSRRGSLEEKGPRIVISVHPNDLPVAEEIRGLLESEGYTVWCTGYPVQPVESSSTAEHPEAHVNLLYTPKTEQQKSACSSEALDAETLAMFDTFKEKVSMCNLVIVVASDSYFKSSVSEEQISYCDRRKPLIIVKTDRISGVLPSLFSNLSGVQLETVS